MNETPPPPVGDIDWDAQFAQANQLADVLTRSVETLKTTASAAVIGEDPRVTLLSEALDNLWDDEDAVPSPHEEAVACVEALDRYDEAQGVVRVNLAKQRAIQAELDRLRGVVHAMLQSFERGGGAVEGPNGTAHVQSIWVPESMFEGWRLAAEGGR